MTTEESFIDFKCPDCGALNSFQDDSAGLVRECVNCMEPLIVPGNGAGTGRKIAVPITTPRLVLRRCTGNDWKDLLEFRFDTEEDVSQWLESDRTVKLTSPDRMFVLGIEAREAGKIIGCLEMRFTDQDFLQAEVSMELNESCRDKGFEVEALQGILAFYFDELNLHRVIARTDSRNCLDARLFEKAGMRCEGEFVQHYRVNGEWLNTVWYAVLADEHRRDGGIPPRMSSS